MRSRCGSPTRPVATASRTDWCAGSKRRLKPIWNGTPACRTTLRARSTSTRSCETGFSQKIALPASAAAAISGACVSVLEQIATASTSGRAISSSAPPATGTPSSSASVRAASGSASFTAATSAPGTRPESSRACIAPIRPTPITPIRSVLTSVLAQRHDVRPAAALNRPEQRRLHAHGGESVLETGAVRPALQERAAELEVLDHHQVFEADPVGAPRHERAVVGEALTAKDRGVAGMRLVGGDVDLKLIHPLKVPAQRSGVAVQVERHLALGSEQRAARLERATRPVLEHTQHSRVVLVRHRADRVVATAAPVMGT